MDKKIAGALFDFCGHLTTLKKEITIGSSQEVTPLLEHLKIWAKTRNLNLDNADVKSWNK